MHLHRFTVHGREYGNGFGADPRRVRLGELGLRRTERFVYDYDFFDLWRHDVRVEGIVGLVLGRAYACCTAGRRARPPKDCGGPWAFLEQSQPYHVMAAVSRVAEMLREILFDGTAGVAEHGSELARFRPWLLTEHFDRRALNQALAQLAVPGRRAA